MFYVFDKIMKVEVAVYAVIQEHTRDASITLFLVYQDDRWGWQNAKYFIPVVAEG
jgi:hypothetical protein